MLQITDLMENEKVWRIRVLKGTKAVPAGEYQLYVRNIKAISSISYKTAFDFIQKGKAEIIK